MRCLILVAQVPQLVYLIAPQSNTGQLKSSVLRELHSELLQSNSTFTGMVQSRKGVWHCKTLYGQL